MTNHYELKIDWGKTQIDYEPETKEMCVCGGGGWGDGRILSEVGLELFFSAFDVGHARSSVRWLSGSPPSVRVCVGTCQLVKPVGPEFSRPPTAAVSIKFSLAGNIFDPSFGEEIS